MVDAREPGPKLGRAAREDKVARERRLAEAMRQNLAKRKAQQRELAEREASDREVSPSSRPDPQPG